MRYNLLHWPLIESMQQRMVGFSWAWFFSASGFHSYGFTVEGACCENPAVNDAFLGCGILILTPRDNTIKAEQRYFAERLADSSGYPAEARAWVLWRSSSE